MHHDLPVGDLEYERAAKAAESSVSGECLV